MVSFGSEGFNQIVLNMLVLNLTHFPGNERQLRQSNQRLNTGRNPREEKDK